MPSLQTVLNAGIAFNLSGSPTFGEASAKVAAPASKTLASGTGTNQADIAYAATRTLAASASENLDLAGSLEDPIGGAVVFAKVKAVYIKAADANTNNVIVGNVTNGAVLGFGAATESFAVKPGGVFMITAPQGGWTIAAGTGDLLKIANSGGTTGVTYDIVVIGTSA